LNNVYFDCFRTLFIKSKCDVLIDTQSNGLLPGVDVTYIHHPIFGRLSDGKTPIPKVSYFLPYRFYEGTVGIRTRRLVFSNSKYTATAIKKYIGIVPKLLYPPISKNFYVNSDCDFAKDDVVISVSRISPEKNLTLIPSIARLTRSQTRFLILGMKQSEQELNRIHSAIEKNEVSDRVEVITDVSRTDLVRILRSAKILLHLSKGEHFGMSIVEAMASGCIPIVYNSGGPTEFVPNSLRFTALEDAAKNIDKTILEWTPQHSKTIINLAQSFSENNFSIRFLQMFNYYIKNKHKFHSKA
jgi:alpha-1,2-mannosyltransferase